MSLLSVFLMLSLSVSGYSFDMDSLVVAQACKQTKNCSPKLKESLDRIKLSCELEVKAQKCEELAKTHPEWARLMRRCDLESLCRQNEEFAKESGLACLRGYKNAMIDLGISLKDMSLSLAGFVEDTWENFKANNKKRNEFIRECNKSIACKRDLVKDDHRYRSLPDDKLNQYSAAFLYVQAQDMKAYMSSMERVRPKPYVPISQRATAEDTQLSIEQREKLQRLMAMVGDGIKEQYQRYSCYHPAAQQELKCYALGNVIDPTLLAGYFVKGGRAALAVSRLGRGEKAAVEVAEAGKIATAAAPFKTRAELIKKYLEFSPTTAAQNEKWIAQASKGPKANMTFLDVENSQMKVLNDSLKDKNLVTSLTNYHKDILFKKIEALKKDYPGLVIDEYSDFKSARFAFSGQVPKDIEQKLGKIFQETNDEFARYLREQNIVRGTDAAESWFRAGVGHSADQANLAARYSRTQNANVVQNYAQGSLQQSMDRQLKSLDRQRKDLRESLSKTNMVEGQTFHQDVFDIVRKNQGDTEKTSAALKNRFALSDISRGTVVKIQDYVKNADSFSPGIHIASREIAHLNDAAQGGLSADIIGLGAANLKGTAEALASAKNMDQALELTRTAEKVVTQNFKDQKKYFEEVIRRSVNNGKLKTLCSGDDCVSVAVSPLNDTEKKKILSGLADSKYSGGYRLAFIPEGVKAAETRNALATHGESMEKILRKNLGATMEPRKLQGLTFGVDMKTQNLNQGAVKLIIGEAPGVRLTSQDRALIERSFREAVEGFNKEAAKEGAKASYHSLP